MRVWVCAASGAFAKNSCLFDFVSDADHYASLSLNAGGSIVFQMKNGETEQTLQAGSMAEGWHHVALTIGEESVAIYVDGVEAASAPVAVRLSDVCPVVNSVGANLLEDVPLMDGFIDDLRIYNYALSADEINDIIGQTIAQPRQTDGWNPPALPGKDVTKITSSESILLYNVDADAFVTYGMDWNTQSLAQRLPKGDTTFSSKYRVKVQRQAGRPFDGRRRIRLSTSELSLGHRLYAQVREPEGVSRPCLRLRRTADDEPWTWLCPLGLHSHA